MKVTLLNPEDVRDLFADHGEFARVCYGTSEKYAEKVGKACAKNGHMSGSRATYIRFRVDGVDRGTAEQCLRHEVGVKVPYEMQDNYSFEEYMDRVTNIPADDMAKNMASFRYIDKGSMSYAIPSTILNNDRARQLYGKLMSEIKAQRSLIKEALIESGVEEHRATQDANYVLPRATTTEFAIAFSPEALVQFMHKRLCVRAQEFIRELATQMKEEVMEVNPEFGKLLVPQCRHLMWCPEGKSTCGAAPSKSEIAQIIKNAKGIAERN